MVSVCLCGSLVSVCDCTADVMEIGPIKRLQAIVIIPPETAVILYAFCVSLCSNIALCIFVSHGKYMWPVWQRVLKR